MYNFPENKNDVLSSIEWIPEVNTAREVTFVLKYAASVMPDSNPNLHLFLINGIAVIDMKKPLKKCFFRGLATFVHTMD